MAKLTREQKIEIYNKRKQGKTISSLSKEYRIREDNIKYLVRLIDKHGIEVVCKDKITYFPPKLKLEILNKVLIDNRSIISTAIEYGLTSDGQLHAWIKSYKENGCVIVEKTRGRKSTMKKPTKKYENMTEMEKIKYLEDKNLYLEAELEYRKKLSAVVQARKNQQPKKK